MKTYLRHRTLNVIDVKGIVALEYLDFEGKYKDYEESHDFWELCFVEAGEITLYGEERAYLLKGGDLILTAPNTRHSYSSSRGNESRAFVACFESPSYMLKFLAGNTFAMQEAEHYCMKSIVAESVNTFTVNDKELLELLPTASFGGQQAIILQLEYLLIALLRRYIAMSKSDLVLLDRENFYCELVGIISDYLRSNINKKIALESVCERFNYSRSFVCRIFKEQTGETPTAFRKRIFSGF